MVARISLKIDGEVFLAELLDKKAPKTVAAISNLLPYERKVIHARFSGEAIWVPLPEDFPVNTGHENPTSYPSRGELLYYPGFTSEKEILIPYGSAIFASKVGLLPGNHFATIREGLDRLEKLGQRVLWEGAKQIVIDLENNRSGKTES